MCEPNLARGNVEALSLVEGTGAIVGLLSLVLGYRVPRELGDENSQMSNSHKHFTMNS